MASARDRLYLAQKELLTVVDRVGNARQTSSGQEGKRCILYMQDDITAGIRRPVRPRGSLLRRGSHGHVQHSHFMLFLIGVLVHARVPGIRGTILELIVGFANTNWGYAGISLASIPPKIRESP